MWIWAGTQAVGAFSLHQHCPAHHVQHGITSLSCHCSLAGSMLFPVLVLCSPEPVDHCFVPRPWGWSGSLCWSVPHGKGHPGLRGLTVPWLSQPFLSYFCRKLCMVWAKICKHIRNDFFFPYYFPYPCSQGKKNESSNREWEYCQEFSSMQHRVTEQDKI